MRSLKEITNLLIEIAGELEEFQTHLESFIGPHHKRESAEVIAPSAVPFQAILTTEEKNQIRLLYKQQVLHNPHKIVVAELAETYQVSKNRIAAIVTHNMTAALNKRNPKNPKNQTLA